TLNFVRGDAVQEAMVDISLTGLLDDLAKRYTSMGQPIRWDGQDEIRFRCRPRALKRALTNLIDNALKHAGDARVSVWTEPDGHIRLEVLDHGPGIEQAWLTHVFISFVSLPFKSSYTPPHSSPAPPLSPAGPSPQRLTHARPPH
ncbi:ATP-binding protein, partial [Pseudomonas viridiflava]|uniref:ATP-binding protein n=1 Tax=Pseudomonas viridiflava TaxID=33069 RepID=UPI001F11EDA6